MRISCLVECETELFLDSVNRTDISEGQKQKLLNRSNEIHWQRLELESLWDVCFKNG